MWVYRYQEDHVEDPAPALRDKQVESLERHSHSFACLHELSPFEVRE